MAFWNKSPRRPRAASSVVALGLLLGVAHCSRINGTTCGDVKRGCVQIYNQFDRSASLSVTPPGTVVDLPAAIHGPTIESGLGAVTVDSTVGAFTVFVLLDGGTAEATATCAVSPTAWTSADPQVVVGASGDPVNELACEGW
jgi:hypothetical protein